ncbi:MAG: heavy metal translocating P-type ATPase, partial [Flavisolibacter sp.]
TLTTGKFQIEDYRSQIDEEEFKRIVYSLEKYSGHPLAKSIVQEWKIKDEIRWRSIEELKGLGMKATDMNGNAFSIGSHQIIPDVNVEEGHNIYVVRNNELIGWIDMKDELRPEAKQVINYLHSKKMKTIILSGDSYLKCQQIANELGIDEIIAGQSPQQKLKKVEELSAIEPTIMVGDGINDAPSLAKASIGISMSEASQLAIQSAQVVLMNNGFHKLPEAIELGKQTYSTIKQNLFWAFAYNIITIPIAAIGLLGKFGPTYGALIMALSDVVLVVNSLRLFVRKSY